MYAVIFKAKSNTLDNEYITMANRMRELAIEKYGCTDFISVSENDIELTISYWKSEEDIKEWKKDTEHIIAQELGQSKWYDSYTIQIAKVVREYSNSKSSNMTIQEAIKQSLKDVDSPKSANEILDHINKNNYYSFGANEPIKAVRPELTKLFNKGIVLREQHNSNEFYYVLKA